MKATELKAGTEYLVFPSWIRGIAKDQRDPALVKRGNYTYRAELVSTTKYNYVVYKSLDSLDQQFQQATSDSKSVGYLVRGIGIHNTGADIFWIARTQDFVGEWAPIESRWTAVEAEYKRLQAEEEAKREEENRRYQEAVATRDRIKDDLIKTINSITGRTPRYVDDNIRTQHIAGSKVNVPTLEIDINTLQRLVEAVLEAREMVA